MQPSAHPSQPEAFRLWREAQDTQVRTRLGGVFYLLAWLLLWGFAGAPGQLLLAGILLSLLFAGLWLLRLLHRLPDAHDQASLRHWLDSHWRLIFATALAWGLTHAAALQLAAFADSRLIATLSTVAFSTAMAFNFAMRKRRAIIAMTLLYLPGLLVLWLNRAEQLASLVTLACYLGYLLLALSRSHREYHTTLDLELQLLEQQARLQQLSHSDSLTQLGNRHLFNNRFPQLLEQARRHQRPLSLVLLDLDFFKQVNDRHGHLTGDACLQCFADCLRRHFRRDNDLLLRLGGEEFAVLLPDTPLEQAVSQAEQLRQYLSSEGLQVHGQPLALTTSIGVGGYDPQQDDDAEDFFRRVDQALYAAKHNGRNCLARA